MQKSELTNGCARNLKKLCRFITNGQFGETIDLLTQGSEHDESDQEPLLKSALYWKGKMEAAATMEQYTQSEFLVTQWDEFVRLLSPDSLPEQYLYALKHFVFGTALKGFLELYRLSGIDDAQVLFRIGKLSKGLGNYEQATQSLELALKQKKNDPAILAELADCYAQIDESRMAKLFFRESFFLDPGAFDLANCETEFIHRIVETIRKENIADADITCWIPVYGTVLGVFNVKRELKPVEIGRLTQLVSELEQKYSKDGTGRDKALLLNRYFWLVDHYISIKAPKADLEAVLSKIQTLDPAIFERYIH